MTGGLSASLDRHPALRLARAVLGSTEAWVVGGTLRDIVMQRQVEDIDLVMRDDPRAAARQLAKAADAHVFQLSERFGAWRVIPREGGWQADFTPVRGGDIEADLAHRDFTVNAMALPLGAGEHLIDPHGGSADIDARRLRVVAEHSYRDDPLRTLRMARLACELDFAVEPASRRLAAQSAPTIGAVAGERVFYELRRLVSCERVMDGLALMDEAGLVREVLPELDSLKGVEQNPYHHLDVWGHTLSVLESLIELEREPEPVFGPHARALTAQLSRPFADELTTFQALRFGALLHDVGKPGTRRLTPEGRVLFLGHDELGASLSVEVCRRLRTSARLAEFLGSIARHHLRLGFLVHERPVSRRHVYGYLRACEPVEVEVTVLSVADRLATRGERTREEAISAHLELAREMTAAALEWRASGVPAAPVGGDELMQALGLEPGPRVGELLELLREAAYAGEVSSREEAIERARSELANRRR